MKKAPPFLEGPDFRSRLLVDCDGEVRPLAQVQDPWQRADYAALDPGFDRAIGRDVESPKMRAYLERPRGHSKTTDIAVCCTRALFSAQRRIQGYLVAADRDQAKLGINAIEMVTRLNAPVRAVLEIQNHRVVNKRTGSELVVMSSDADSSYGILPSFVVADELTHWGDAGERLWESLFSSAAKRASCMLTVISNAGLGMGSSWQWRVRENFRTNPDCYFSRLDGPKASWITAKVLAEQQRGLTQLAYSRLWLNEWTTAAGDMLTADMIADAVDDTLRPMTGLEPAWAFFSGLDLATRRDHAAHVVLGFNPRERKPFRLAAVDSWIPPKGGEIDLNDVFLSVEQRAHEFRGQHPDRNGVTIYPLIVCADPWQAQLGIQQLQRRGVVIYPVPMIGQTLTKLAMVTIQAFSERLLAMYPDQRLLAELSRLSIVEQKGGFGAKIVAPRTADGHCDRGVALAIALHCCAEYAGEHCELEADNNGIDVVGTILGPNYLD